MKRPELGPLKAGDKVFVIHSDTRRSTVTEHVVSKVGRVWVHLEREDQRFRLSGQKGESQYGYGAYFATPEQREYDQRIARAHRTLRDHGIELRWDSPWAEEDAALMALATFLETSGIVSLERDPHSAEAQTSEAQH